MYHNYITSAKPRLFSPDGRLELEKHVNTCSKKMSNVPFRMNEEEYFWSPQFSNGFFKLSASSDCKPKFPDQLNGKHPKFGYSKISNKSFGI